MKYFVPLICAIVLCTATPAIAQKDSTRRIDDQSQDFIPEITANSDDLSESISNENVSSMLAATHDIYAATAAFRLRQAGFKYRGYGNDEFTTIVNGVLLNDPENGGVFWGATGAFNDMTHNRDGNIGLSPSTNAFGGLGGSYHVDTRPGAQREGFNIAYTATDRSYFNRLSASYSTGYIKGWAVSLAFSRRWAVTGYDPGTSFDGYGYFFAVERKLNLRMLFAHGGQQRRDVVPHSRSARSQRRRIHADADQWFAHRIFPVLPVLRARPHCISCAPS